MNKGQRCDLALSMTHSNIPALYPLLRCCGKQVQRCALAKRESIRDFGVRATLACWLLLGGLKHVKSIDLHALSLLATG